MTKTAFTLTAAVAALIGTTAFAGPVEDLVAQLRADGYQKIEVESGRDDKIKIEAENGTEEREIVMIAATGEVLYDMAEIESHDDDDRDGDDDSRDGDDD